MNALDRALRSALNGRFPALERVHLTDYKVRVLDTNKGTGAVTRVLIDSTDGDATWTTIGVNENIIEASWQALLDSIQFGLLRARARSDRRGLTASVRGACRPIRSSPPDPADRPRQQQNLPPGLALPPAGRLAGRPARRPRRPGSPSGALLGRPGPNVGYAYTLAERVADRLRARAARARRRRRSR